MGGCWACRGGDGPARGGHHPAGGHSFYTFQTLSYSIEVPRPSGADPRYGGLCDPCGLLPPAGRRPHRAGHAPAPPDRAGPRLSAVEIRTKWRPICWGCSRRSSSRTLRRCMPTRPSGTPAGPTGDGTGRARLCSADLRGLQRVFGHRHGTARLFGIRLCSNFRFPISPATSASSGGVGTSRSTRGSATTSTSRSGAPASGDCGRCSTWPSCSS